MRPILLDTCAAIWLDRPGALRPNAELELQRAQAEGIQVLVSPITAWEIGVLVARGRLVLSMPPLKWFEAILRLGIDLAELTPEILVASSGLPDKVLRDPSDCIVAATARAHGYRLMTRDGPLLEFSKAGHVQAIPC